MFVVGRSLRRISPLFAGSSLGFCSYDPPRFLQTPYISSEEHYKELYEESVEKPDLFWSQRAESLHWQRKYDTVLNGSFTDGDVRWFTGGKINVSENCIDRHVNLNPEKIAIIWEGDEPGTERRITYKELLHNVSQISNALISAGVKKGDSVCIYMPMVPEAAFAMLACARIGAPHSVVFAGFSSAALRDRIVDAKSKVIITADEGLRGGKHIPLKKMVDDAIEPLGDAVETVFVHQRTKREVPMRSGRDQFLSEAMARERPYCPPVPLDSEDPLFILYTSGSTGKPKGLVHTNAGYILYASLTHKWIFDYKPDDIYACVADIGWITGHSYVVYGPLANGATTVMFESLPTYPNASRYWELVERLKINSFYTAPTAIRTLMKFEDNFVKKYDLSSLRVLGSVGEPLNPEAWKWYHGVVGNSKCSIVDTYWQTETGGIICTPLPGVHSMKPGATMYPFFGIVPQVQDPLQKETTDISSGVLTISKPWPGMARTILYDHERYMQTYFQAFPGTYFTGDGCQYDEDDHIWITGRVDDVINKAGHRLGTAEIESALVANSYCTEAAVVGVPDDVKGEMIVAFCVGTKEEPNATETEIKNGLKLQVRTEIGPLATPDILYLVSGLPKTRSGKIMRRMLRKIAEKNFSDIGDISTLADQSVIDKIVSVVRKY